MLPPASAAHSTYAGAIRSALGSGAAARRLLRGVGSRTGSAPSIDFNSRTGFHEPTEVVWHPKNCRISEVFAYNFQKWLQKHGFIIIYCTTFSHFAPKICDCVGSEVLSSGKKYFPRSRNNAARTS